MISKRELFEPLLLTIGGFQNSWNAFLNEWEDEIDPPYSLLMQDLAQYISLLIKESKHDELIRIFQALELWHIKDNSHVKELATIGLLEDLQSTSISKQVEPFLLPESKRMWLKINEFWGDD